MLSAAKHLTASLLIERDPSLRSESFRPERSEWGDTEGKHSHNAIARQHCQVLLNLAVA
jgi:hypothetical protein